MLVITYTRAAAGELRSADPRARCASAAATTSRASSTAPGSRRSTASAAGCCARIRSRPGSTRASACSTRARRRVLRGEAFDARARGVLRRRTSRSGCGCSRRTAPAGCGGCSRASTRRSARPGATSCSSSASGRASTSARRRAARRGGGAARRRRRRPRRSAERRRASCSIARRRIAARAAARSLGDLALRGRARRVVRARRARRSSRRRSRSSPRATASCCRSCSSGFGAAYAAAKDRESALDFEDLQLARPRPASRRRRRSASASSSRFRSIMVDEFQDTNRLQCELIDLLAQPDRRPRSSSSATSSSRSTASGTPTSRSSASGATQAAERARADAELPLAPARCSRRSTTSSRATFGDELPAARGVGASSPIPVFGHAGRAARHRQGELRGHRRALAPGEARRIARRVRELVDAGEATPGEIVLLFAAGHRRRVVRGGAARASACRPTARPGAATSASSRSSTCSPTCGCCTTATTTRRSLTVLASPFVGVSNDALVLIRRAAPNAAALHRRSSGRCREQLAAARRAAACAPSCSATSGSCAALGAALARAALRADRRRARLRPRRARPLGRPAPLREPAQARAARALVRGAARRRPRGLRPLRRASRTRSARRSSRPSPRRRARTPSGCSRSTPRRGSSSRSSIVADAGRDSARPRGPTRSSASPTGGSASEVADPATRQARGRRSTTRRCKEAERGGRSEAERLRLYYVAMTRAIDRLIVSGAIDPGAHRRPSDADRLGARPARRATSTVVEAGDAPVELERGDARFVLAVDRVEPRRRGEPRRAASEAADDERSSRSSTSVPARRARGSAPSLPPLAEIPAPPLHDVRAALLQRARALRALLVPLLRRARRRACAPTRASGASARTGRRAWPRPRSATPSTGCSSSSTSTRPAAPPRRARRPRPRLVPGRDRRGARADRGSRRRVLRVASSPRASPALAGARPERPFAFEHDGVLLHGRLDVLWRDGGAALVVDYKTNALDGRDARRDRRGASTGCSGSSTRSPASAQGRARSRSSTSSSSGRTTSSRRRSRRADVPTLEAELSAAIARIRAGDFRPTPSEFVCADCPALDLVCAGPRLGLAR